MEDIKKDEAYKKLNIPRSLNIMGYNLTYKDPPLKGELYRYRCRTKNCNFFIKINKENITKLQNNENDIQYIEMNVHTNHKEIKYIIDDGDIKSEEQIKKIATNLIKLNLKEPLSFHINNLKNNKITLKKKELEIYYIL